MSTSTSPTESLSRLVPTVEESPVEFELKPPTGWTSLRLKEFWAYRELLYFLTWRDVKVRYKQTALGAAWALLQPLAAMVIFSLFFGRVANMPSDGLPYPVFVLTGLVPWMFFANGLTQASNSLVGNSRLITKVYFPRLIIPVATILAGLVDFFVSFVLLIGMMVIYHITPTWNILFLPVFLLLACITALGVGLWFSAWNVQYRDVQYIIPFIAQFWMYATPVPYPSSRINEPWRTLSALNPMVGVVEGFRWSLLGVAHYPGPLVFVSVGAAIGVLIGGAYYFRRMEKSFADRV